MFTCFGYARQNVVLVMEWFRNFCPNASFIFLISPKRSVTITFAEQEAEGSQIRFEERLFAEAVRKK